MLAKVTTAPDGLYMLDRPSVFLAGPIQDAPDWQSEVIEALSDRRITIYNPRTPDPWHGDYSGQVRWETDHLWAASVVLFWLALPSQPPSEGRSYAQTSRFELGEWFARSKQDGRFRLVVGIESGFPGERYIRTRLAGVQNITICSNLEESIQTLKDTLDPLERLVRMEGDGR